MTGPVPPEPAQDRPADPESVARAICLRALTQRARSRAELAATLRRRGVPDDAAGAVLDRFTEVGLIDDAALAASAARVAHAERGLAGRAVAMKLRQRGLPEEAVSAAVAQIDAASERDRAEALVRRKLPALRGVEPQAQARRLVGLLARRGYAPELAHHVVRSVVADVGAEDAPD